LENSKHHGFESGHHKISILEYHLAHFHFCEGIDRFPSAGIRLCDQTFPVMTEHLVKYSGNRLEKLSFAPSTSTRAIHFFEKTNDHLRLNLGGGCRAKGG
jgi:hypothetical protein